MSSGDRPDSPPDAPEPDAEPSAPAPEPGADERARVAAALAAAAAGDDPVEASARVPVEASDSRLDEAFAAAARSAVDHDDSAPSIPTRSSSSSSSSNNAGAWIAVGIICSLFTVILVGLNLAERRRQEQMWNDAFTPFGSNYDYGYGYGDPLQGLGAYDDYAYDGYDDYAAEPLGESIAIPASTATRELPGACVERIDTNEDGYADRQVERAYDSEGRIIQQSDGSLRTEYTYERGGRIVRERELFADGTLAAEAVRQLDGSGNPVRVTMDGESTTYENRYDGAGRLLSTGITFAGVLEEEHTNTYDRRGNLVREEIEELGTRVYSAEHSYDRDGRKVRSDIDEGADGYVDEVRRFVYDADGRVSQETVDFDRDGEADERTDYAYDDAGNVVRKSTTRYSFVAEDITYDYRCFD